MITIYLLDKNGVFAGTAMNDPHQALPPCVLTPPPAGAEFAQWDGTAWVALEEYPTRPPTVPSAVTMRQARLALLGAGLLDDVDAAINAMPSPQKEAARIAWEYSQEVQRHNGVVAVLGPALGLTDAQIDALFIAAEKL